jgi:glyoxylase-like metal-dependent hydrolase (beta-lactamase superfamily II)
MSERIAEGVHRLGNELVNYYLVEGDGGLTLIDAGVPRMRAQLEPALAALGRTVADLRAIALTHGHADHVGYAEALRAEHGIPVYVHEADAELARTQKTGKREGGLPKYLRNRAFWQLMGEMVRGGLPKGVKAVRTYRDGEVLDVPGRPRVIHGPGHSDGCSALLLEDRGVLLTGDVLCSWNPMTGRRGVQIMPSPFNRSNAQAVASIERLSGVDAGVLAFGHGEPWRDGVPAALDSARRLGVS